MFGSLWRKGIGPFEKPCPRISLVGQCLAPVYQNSLGKHIFRTYISVAYQLRKHNLTSYFLLLMNRIQNCLYFKVSFHAE